MNEGVPGEDKPVGCEYAEPAQQCEHDRRPEPVPGEEGEGSEPVLKKLGCF